MVIHIYLPRVYQWHEAIVISLFEYVLSCLMHELMQVLPSSIQQQKISMDLFIWLGLVGACSRQAHFKSLSIVDFSPFEISQRAVSSMEVDGAKPFENLDFLESLLTQVLVCSLESLRVSMETFLPMASLFHSDLHSFERILLEWP